MSASILSTILLVSPAPLPSTAQLPSLVEPESGAWAVVHAGQLWVCWDPGPDCFERVVFDDRTMRPEDQLDADEPSDELMVDLEAPEDLGIDGWQLGFSGPRSLWVEHGERRWRVVRGQRRARLVEEPAPVRLGRIGPAGCGPDGIVPAAIHGRLSWREAPRCVVEVMAQTCVAPAGPRLRTPTPIRLRAGIEIAATRAWTAKANPALGLAVADRRRTSGFELGFVIEIGFDWQRRSSAHRARALVSSLARARVRELPAVAPGMLAAAELEALADVVCGGTR